MSQENVELVRRSYAAYAEIGTRQVASFYAEDHVAYAVPEWPDDSEYHGPEGVRKLSRQWTENFDDFGLEVREVRDAGDAVVALLDMTGRIKGSAVPVHQPVGAVHGDFSNGLIGETRYFLTWREALEAAGLEEQPMSQENVEMITRVIEAWNRQDLSGFLEGWHADAEWRPAFPKGTEGTGSVFSGCDGVERAWHNVRAAWTEYRLDVQEARWASENLVVLGRIHVRGATSDVEIDSDWSALVRFQDNKVISAWDWLDHASALEAAGLRSSALDLDRLRSRCGVSVFQPQSPRAGGR